MSPNTISGEGNGTPLQHSCLENPIDRGAWWAAFHGVAKSQTRLSDFTFTFQFHALENEMATHSSVLAWRIPGTGEPRGLPSMGSHRVGHDWRDLAAAAAIPLDVEVYCFCFLFSLVFGNDVWDGEESEEKNLIFLSLIRKPWKEKEKLQKVYMILFYWWVYHPLINLACIY